jgi:hypothetical protein
MTWALLAVLIVVVLAIVARLQPNGRSSAKWDGPWPFEKKQMLSRPEQTLYHRLKEALPECEILAQVHLLQMLKVRPKTQGHKVWLNRIAWKSLDFVVCLKDFSVVAVVELDDRTHDKPDRKSADLDKEMALEGAGIPIVRWHVHQLPSIEEIRAKFTT